MRLHIYRIRVLSEGYDMNELIVAQREPILGLDLQISSIPGGCGRAMGPTVHFLTELWNTLPW